MLDPINYCGEKINPQYFILEFSTAFVSTIIYLSIGFSELYLLLLLLWVSTILAGLIHLNSGKIYHELTFVVISIGMVYRTLSDSSILPFITDIALASTFLSLIMKSSRLQIREVIHLVLQASTFGLDKIFIVFLSYIITKKFIPKNSYLYSLISLSSVTILRNIF